LGIINIKLRRYILVTEDTYLIVVGNPNIKQEDVDFRMKNKKVPLPTHIRVVTADYIYTEVIPYLLQKSDYSKV
jgi:hypothetical protein